MIEPSPTRRALRAAALIGLALVAVLVAGVAYLRPSFRTAASPMRPASVPVAVGPVSFADADHGMVSVFRARTGAVSTLFLTRDGGRTWAHDPGVLGSVLLSGALSGSRYLVVGKPAGDVRVSADGGLTWRTLPTPPGTVYAGPFYGGGPVLLDPAHAWWLMRPAPADPYDVELWRTSDGSTWTRLPAAGIPSGGLKLQLWFSDERHGFLTVLDAMSTASAASVLATDDGGATWREAAHFGQPFAGAWVGTALLLAHGGRLLLFMGVLPNVPPSQGAGIGPTDPLALNLGVYTAVSMDGGATWRPLAAGPGLSSASIPQFDDRGRLLLLSDRRLWTSTTFGAGWQSRPVALPAGVRALTLVDAVPGALFAVGVPPRPPGQAVARAGPPATVLLRSRDGGDHWEQLSLPDPAG